MPSIVRLHSDRVHAVEETLPRVFPTARIQNIVAEDVAFAWTSVDLDGVVVIEYRLRGDVQFRAEHPDQINAVRVAGPRVALRVGRREFDGARPYLSPRGLIEASWNGDARVQGISIDLAVAEQIARQVLGDDRFRLHVEDVSAVSPALGRYWAATTAHLSDVLLDEGMPLTPVLHAELRRSAVESTLAVFRTNLAAHLERARQRGAAPASVRRAIAYIEAHAHEPITVDDVARAAGMSTFGLVHACRRALDADPADLLRRARLDGARSELDRLAEHTPARVSDVVRRWGYVGLPSFLADLRRSQPLGADALIAALGVQARHPAT